MEDLECRVLLTSALQGSPLFQPSDDSSGVTEASLTVQTPGIIGTNKVVESNNILVNVYITSSGDGTVGYSGSFGSVPISGTAQLGAPLSFNVDAPQELGPANVQLTVGGVLTNSVEIDVCGLTSAQATVDGGTTAVALGTASSFDVAATLTGWGGSEAVGGTDITYNWEYAPVGSDDWTLLPTGTVTMTGALASLADPLTPPGTGNWDYRLVTFPNPYLDWGCFSVTSNEVEVDNILPDLTGQLVLQNPSPTYYAGETISPQLTITAKDAAANGTELTNYYLSTNSQPTFDQLDDYLNTCTEPFDSLAGGSSYTENPSLTIPDNTTPGTYYLVAAINVSQAIPESNYTNDLAVYGPITITPATKTTVVSLANPSVFGQPVTFNATVISNISGSGTPTGTVDFYDNSIDLLGWGSLDGAGNATFTTGSGNDGLSVGIHSISAVYNGDLPSSTSASIQQTVHQDGTDTALVSSVNPSIYGRAITFTATVSPKAPGGGTPSGSVDFFDGSVCWEAAC